MPIPFISAGAIAAVLALTSAAAFGDNHNPPPTGDYGSTTNEIILGQLASLPDFLTRWHPTAPTTNTAASQVPERPDGTRSETPATVAKNPYVLPANRERLSAPEGTRLESQINRIHPEASQEQTLVLIAQPLAVQSLRPPSTGSGGRTFTGISDENLTPSPRKDSVFSTTSTSGLAYILLFSEEASSQAAFLRAKAMIADRSAQWATSADEARDRLQVRGTDDTDRAARRDASRPQQTGESAIPGHGEASNRWTRDGSQVRVTGRVMSRGGIHAIQVSEISLAGMADDGAKENPGTPDREQPSRNDAKKPE